MLQKIIYVFVLLILISSLAMANGEHSNTMPSGPDPKTFKMLKEKSIDPETGLPKTLDPDLFKGKVKQAYRIAREIPKILAQMPCLCECEEFGHENLLDCYIDDHAAG